MVELAQSGLPPRDIARLLASTVNLKAVYQIIHRARQDGVDIPSFMPETKVGENYSFALKDPALVAVVRRAAERRGQTIRDLASELMTIIARDDMFAAVLDDGDDAPRTGPRHAD